MARHPAAPCLVRRTRTSAHRVMFQRIFRAKATAFVEATFHVARPIVAQLATDLSATVDLAISVVGTYAAASAPCCNRSFGHFCDQENMYIASFESS